LAAYGLMLAGRADPREAWMLGMQEEGPFTLREPSRHVKRS
jgi:hypothetical protein